jgi:hypothetical protein
VKQIDGVPSAVVKRIESVPPAAAAGSFAAQRRRESRRQEWTEQIKLAEMLDKYLDPADTFWTSLENKPISRLSGIFQKKRGVRSGLPDVQVIWRGKPIFVELKSRAGKASKVQKHVRLKMLPAGADWWLARSARAAMMALHLSGVVFLRDWKPPRLKPWEGPFADPTWRLPQAPDVAARRRAARRRWLSRRPRACKTSNLATKPPHPGAPTARREKQRTKRYSVSEGSDVCPSARSGHVTSRRLQ